MLWSLGHSSWELKTRLSELSPLLQHWIVQRWQKLLFCCPGWNLATRAGGRLRRIVCVVHHRSVHQVLFCFQVCEVCLGYKNLNRLVVLLVWQRKKDLQKAVVLGVRKFNLSVLYYSTANGTSWISSLSCGALLISGWCD